MCDRKSISFPVDAKFITLAQNSGSLFALASIATSVGHFFFLSIFSPPGSNIGKMSGSNRNTLEWGAVDLNCDADT